MSSYICVFSDRFFWGGLTIKKLSFGFWENRKMNGCLYTGPRNQLPSCMNKENIFSVTRPVILYFWGKVKRQGCKFISPQLSINISHWRFYFISNWKSSMILYWINLIKWIVMKQQGITFKGKDTFLFIFNVLPQIPIYAVFSPLFTLFFSVVTYLLRIHTFVRAFWKI